MKLFIKRISFHQVLSLSPCPSVSLSFCLFLPPFLLSLPLYLPLFPCPCVCVCVCVCVCMSICLSLSASLFLSSPTLCTHFWTPLPCVKGFPVVKNLPANAGATGDVGSIPRLGRSPGGGHGNLLQHSCLENPMDRGA